MIAFVRQGVNAAQSIQLEVAIGHFAWLNDLWVKIQHRFPAANARDLSESVRHYGELAGGLVAARIGTILKHSAIFLFDLGVTILAMFYFYRDGAAMLARLRKVLPFGSAYRERMLGDTHQLIFASVTSSLVAAAVHAALGGLAFAVTGVKAPIFWGVMMGFLSFVPLVGSALVWLPISISLMIAGHLLRGLLLVFFCAVIVGLVENPDPAMADQRSIRNERTRGIHQRAGRNQRVRAAWGGLRADCGGGCGEPSRPVCFRVDIH